MLYDDDPKARISYPDFVEDHGRYFITETQKAIARAHEIDPTLLEGFWNQAGANTVAKRGLALELKDAAAKSGASFDMPRLPRLDSGGFTIDFWVRFRELSPGQIVLDSRDASGKGIALTFTDRFTIQLVLNDGRLESTWDCDPGTHPGTLKIGAWQHIAVVVDGGPKIITWVVDGILNDGGAVRDFGWGRFHPDMMDVNGAPTANVAPLLFGELRNLRVYSRYLRTSEVVGNFRAGQKT